ncbi:MAG: sigma 54-interacting transcriptional regulator [Polyangiaceae bacterium]|nr:sigma 54-interacting transcriptional regulator [Polyangiaceae bacterium]
MTPVLPPRFEAVEPLGKGGGGEVWSVRDRLTGRVVALKALGERADEEESLALVREAIALSGLEGLDVPRVLRFGRLPTSDRPYLVRELVHGESLASLCKKLSSAEPDRARAKLALLAVARAANQLTALHRAQLLHGDVKPANIIVSDEGKATLVDLGLATAFRDRGAQPKGLTLLYAAPELLEGGALTVRAEVFALGATLRDVLEAAKPALDAREVTPLDDVVRRATNPRPEARYPSVDELANALFVAMPDLRPKDEGSPRAAWPVVGLDEPARALARHVEGMDAGTALVVTGPRGSGRTTLMRRVAWTLGLGGRKVAWIEAKDVGDPLRAIELESEGVVDRRALIVLVDDAEHLSNAALDALGRLREEGTRVVVTASGEARIPGPTLEVFPMARLEVEAANDLVLRNLPSLNETVVAHVVERAQRWPGPLRSLVEQLQGAPVVGVADVDRLAATTEVAPHTRRAGQHEAVEAIRAVLERGHFEEAAELLEAQRDERSIEIAILRARLASNQGEWRRSLEELASVADELDSTTDTLAAEYLLELARAHLRAGDNAACEQAADEVVSRYAGAVDDAVAEGTPRRLVVAVTEAKAIGGLAKSFLAKHDEARAWLASSVEIARALADARTLSITLGSLAFALQRTGKLDEAQTAYEEALTNAEAASDAGTLATTRLNLAGVAKAKGDLSQALVHLEAAVDMGRRSGRRATLRQALLNLANLDVYLGRLARARVSIETLALERMDLPPHFAAQLLALEGEHAAKSRELERAEALCRACADAYRRLSRPVDAAEAMLEGLFATFARVGNTASSTELADMRARVQEAERLLGTSEAHRAALELARAKIAVFAQDVVQANAAFDRSIKSAEASKKRDWLARAYQARAAWYLEEGQRLAARRDREAALAVLEEIASRLPRDLREVYWDDPMRRSLRDVEVSLHAPAAGQTLGASAIPGAVVREDRFARLLEINRQIAGTYDLKRLLERVTDHAIALLAAERGFIILKSEREDRAPGDLSIHASRDQAGDDPHARFSQSIAERVIRSSEPIVTSSARDDIRMADYVSVHQLMLQSVACVPIRSRSAGTIGALYLETRLRSVASFAEELPLLVALADQVAIAIETARLVSENERRAQALEKANSELEDARKKLEELLGHRTAQLQATRRDLRSARAVLKSHFGYEGLVGTSEAMRRVYALIDRVKDTDVPVLLVGESGTGKEVVARAIHNASPRARSPFLGLNCGAIPEHLLESELFGHVRGAFTGAERDRRGLFREATGGTLLLDEIGEMAHKMQAGLLRVLQEKVVRPVGGAREESVDTRVIAATHRDLQAMVEEGKFREDLFYRLNVIQVRVPPLRERIDDIPVLIDHFLGIFAARYHRERRSVSRAALKMLVAHRWPGNVRQLENALLNAWVLSDGPELEIEDFELTDPSAGAALRKPAPAGQPAAAAPSVATSLDAHRANERDRILQALSACNWNRVRAAELIGMPRRTFYRRLREYGIQ